MAGWSGPLDLTQLAIAVLKADKVVRQSGGADLLNLLDSGKLVVVDTRTPEDCQLGSLLGSTNLPAALVFSAGGELAGGVREVEQARWWLCKGTTGNADPPLYPACGGRRRPALHHCNC